MIRYVLRRLGLLIPTLLGILVVVFAILHLIPGDPATFLLGEHATPTAVADLRHRLGLDQPLPLQFVRYVWDVAHGDLGRSITTNNPVALELGQRFGATFELAVSAMILAVAVGLPLGLLAAVRRNSWLDSASMGGALVGISMPIFWLGLILIMIFATRMHFGTVAGIELHGLQCLPFGQRADPATTFTPITNLYLLDSLLRGRLDLFWQFLRHLILPALALSTVPMAIIARMTRSSLLDVWHQEYVRTARAKGLGERAVLLRHALPNALVPVVTIIGLEFGYLLGGAILTETVFQWPGLGKYVVDAILARDYPQVQGAILLIAATFVAVNVLVDLLYARLDPRIRTE